MAVPAAVLLLLLLLALLVPLAGLVLGTVLLGLPSYDIPAGVNQPAKLRLVLAVLLGTAALVSGAGRWVASREDAGIGAVGATLGAAEDGEGRHPLGQSRCRDAGRHAGLAGRLAKGGDDASRGAEPAIRC